MSEDRKECHVCENFNKCNENVSYESNYCNVHRKQKCDKSVANIEADVKKVKRYLENSAYKESESDFFKNGGWEMVDLEIPQAMANILAERERDKARIKKLEEENRIFVLEGNKISLELHIKENYIPKQVVNLKIANLKKQIEEKDKILDEVNSVIKKQQGTETDLDAAYQYYDETYDEKQKLNYQVNILEKLLEGEK